MSASCPQPAVPEAAPRRAGDLGRRHGRAAVSWQVGDSGSSRQFYRELLDGIASADPAITGLYAVPDLTARWNYERENLAADLGLDDGDPALDQAAEAYLAAARDEFWLEATRLARRRLEFLQDKRSQASRAATFVGIPVINSNLEVPRRTPP